MGRQSTTAVALRALVMLSCLVVLPLMAVFGDSIRQWAEPLLEENSPLALLTGGREQDSANDSLEEAPRFEPLASNAQASMMGGQFGAMGLAPGGSDPATARAPAAHLPAQSAPRSLAGSASPTAPSRLASPERLAPPARISSTGARALPSPPNQPGARPTRPDASGRNQASGSSVTAAGYDRAAWPPAASPSHRGEQVMPAGYDAASPGPAARSLDSALGGSGQRNGGVHPAGFSSGRDAASADAGYARLSDDQQLAAMHQRLRELGATYLLLETWGEQRQAFRFYCKIAIAGNPHYTYRFEATDTDPIQAMRDVVDQVEQWRAKR